MGWALSSRGKALWVSPAGTSDYYIEETGTPYKVFKLPFDYRGENAHIFNAEFFRENGEVFNDGDIYTIKFRDSEVTYYLKEIAEELGLQ
ncbi:MAG: hypothetical protein IJZ72_00335 [Oscillospiraceae bacterium]|nr:hypothetical protein [Oscillospiraceae bacterium]